jgi:hypothetical protein
VRTCYPRYPPRKPFLLSHFHTSSFLTSHSYFRAIFLQQPIQSIEFCAMTTRLTRRIGNPRSYIQRIMGLDKHAKSDLMILTRRILQVSIAPPSSFLLLVDLVKKCPRRQQERQGVLSEERIEPDETSIRGRVEGRAYPHRARDSSARRFRAACQRRQRRRRRRRSA